MTIKEFFEAKNEIVINCDTKEKAIKLCEEFDKQGYTWQDGDSYLEVDVWNWFKNNTCYSNKGDFGYKIFYEDQQVPIYKFEEIELEVK